MPLVYSFRCRLSAEAETLAFAEMARGRALYNQMIAEYNPHPRQRALTVVARHKQSDGDCYGGTHEAVVAAFQAATSAKRAGKFPGDPYRFRSRFEHRGAKIGAVWHASKSVTWGKVLSGALTTFSCVPGEKIRRNYSQCSLRISREDPPIRFTANIRRQIPVNAVVTSAYLVPNGEHGERRWWDLQITFDAPIVTVSDAPIVTVSDAPIVTVGIDLGWSLQPDGSMLVAVTSSGYELRVPAYAMRMAARVEELQSIRDKQANWTKGLLADRGIQCPAKSADGVIGWVESNGIIGVSNLVDDARALRRKQQHVRRRFLGIRDELYRDFASLHRGAFILKTNLKQLAETKNDLKGTEPNHERTWVSLSSLAQYLRERGSVEVSCERLGDSLEPTAENAEQIRLNGESGNLVIRVARKPHRKFRKSLEPSSEGQNAITTARLS